MRDTSCETEERIVRITSHDISGQKMRLGFDIDQVKAFYQTDNILEVLCEGTHQTLRIHFKDEGTALYTFNRLMAAKETYTENGRE